MTDDIAYRAATMADPDLSSAVPRATKPTPSRRRTRQAPDVRRRDLLDVTVSCLARLGPRATTGREICRQAGVSHGLIRHYFRNPDNLLLETYESLCEDMLAELAASAEGPGDPWGRLHAFLGAVFAPRWTNPEIIGAWMVFWQLARGRPDFGAVSARYNAAQRALLETLVGAVAGPAVVLDRAVAIVSAVMDGLWIEHYLSETRTPADLCVALTEETVRRVVG